MRCKKKSHQGPKKRRNDAVLQSCRCMDGQKEIKAQNNNTKKGEIEIEAEAPQKKRRGRG